MREDFLHFLWRTAAFDLHQLRTTAYEQIEIINFGLHNSNAGPDFNGARLKINGMNWAGHVEIHIRSSDWYAHGHQSDPAYDNVILHVVLEEDRPVYRANGEQIPCLELKGRVPARLINNYWRLMHNEYWIPCQTQLDSVSELVRRQWLDRLLRERLARRSAELEQRLEDGRRDWEEVFYQSIARSLGGKVNADAMEMLARSIPLRVLLRHKHSQLQVEALLFGQSGLLPEDSEEDYPQVLLREYRLLAIKYELRPLPVAVWRYLRLRPANFPTIRIAQLARLIVTSGQLFGKTLAAANTRELENMYNVELSNYWRNHHRFGQESKRSFKRLGISTIHSILINTVAPLLELYGKLRDDESIREQAIDLLNSVPAEKNNLISKWAANGMKAHDAADTQALLELKKYYCDRSRCLECSIGCTLLKRNDGAAPPLTLNEEALLYTYGLNVVKV
ncbi:hypothetical protein CEQ90_12990 [Lewinellaceae bacterium SD302]|nr:hypothetical protein CEQ90_12990 [Lewinellaceae bacterium SD302]